MKLSKEQWVKVGEEFKNGMSVKDLCNKYNCSSQTINRHLKNMKLKNNRQSKWVDDNYFDDIDNEEKAYLLGFLVADGCIREEIDTRSSNWKSFRICFSNSIDDKEIMDLIHNKICPNHMMIEVHNTNGAKNRKAQLILQWTSNHMTDVLINKYKIVPHKTSDQNFKFPFDLIPEKFHRHFIRGFMDGDGSINKSELRFVFTSKLFMNQIINKFKELFKDYSDVVWNFSYSIKECSGKTAKYWTVFIPMGHGRDKLIKNYLYNNANVYLARKYNKAYGIKSEK